MSKSNGRERQCIFKTTQNEIDFSLLQNTAFFDFAPPPFPFIFLSFQEQPAFSLYLPFSSFCCSFPSVLLLFHSPIFMLSFGTRAVHWRMVFATSLLSLKLSSGKSASMVPVKNASLSNRYPTCHCKNHSNLKFVYWIAKPDS
jgi:hypothetical protein